MKLEHKFVVPAPVEETWAAFNDLQRVVPCFPGAALTSYEGDDFTGTCKVKLGPVSLQYSGTGTFVERDESTRSAVIEAKGKDRRGNGTATAHVTTRLTGTSEGSTEVVVDTELTITGRPAQFGRGLIQEVSDKLLDQFTACLTTKLRTAGARSDGDTGPAEEGAGERAGAGTEQALAASSAAAEQPAAASPIVDEATPPTAGSQDGSAEAEPEPLDLGSALLPMLAKRAIPYLIGAALALALSSLARRLIRR